MADKMREQARQMLRSIIRTDGRIDRFPGMDCGIVIALDVDEVMALVHPVMIELYNKGKGTSYTIEDHSDWDFRGIGSNYLEMMKHYVDAWKNHWQEIKLGGSRECIAELGQYFVLDMTSSRDRDSITGGSTEGTDKWIRMHRLDWIPCFYDSTGINKRMLEYSVNIDDSPKLAESFAFADCGFLLLVDKRYNRHIPDGNRILRIEGLDGAVDELISAAIAVGREKRLYQDYAGQRFIREGVSARDEIIAECMTGG